MVAGIDAIAHRQRREDSGTPISGPNVTLVSIPKRRRVESPEATVRRRTKGKLKLARGSYGSGIVRVMSGDL